MNNKKMTKIGFLVACFLLINVVSVIATEKGDKTTDWEAVFLSLPETSYAYEHLAYYTSLPHIAGSPEDYETAVYTAEKLKSYGLNNTHIVPTNVLLSYPKKRVVEMTHPTAFRAGLVEDVIPTDPTTSDPRIVDTFNGYSPSGNVTGELVYVNYGSMDDFETLFSLGINVTGKIAIARYGSLFRGTKAMIAQNYGMIGLLIYSDPADDGYTQGPVFPEGPWRPATGVQRGSVQFLSICPGDPSRSVCSNNINYNYTMGIPSIPVQPLSWQDAYPLLVNLGNTPAPSNFQGGLNFTYHIGPGPTQVHIYLEMDFLENHPIWNVITMIEGVDTQKTVILGNHRDAWVFGATDPNSGTAVLLEVGRCFGEMLAEGWKPARNIILASWDGEEYGLLGSTAWVEANADMVQKTVVAYLNVDVAVTGPTFGAAATPSLESVIHQAARQVIDPNSGKPLAEVWNTTVGTLGSGSDYTAFLDHFGIPCTDMGFDGPYGVYHSIYDDLQWMLNFGDPTFAYHKATVQMWGLMAMKLADAEIIPYNFTMYADRLVEYRQTLVETIQDYNVTLDLIALDNAINAFKTAARKIETEILNETLPAQNLNDRMVFTEREFLSSVGTPNRPYYKHVIQAPGLYAGYDAETYPGLTDAIMYGNSTTIQQQYTMLWQQISKAASLLSGAVPKDETDKTVYPITIE